MNNWNDIENLNWDNPLQGNGFSIGISQKFSYGSRLGIVDECNVNVYPHARELCDEHKIGAVSFEEA